MLHYPLKPPFFSYWQVLKQTSAAATLSVGASSFLHFLPQLSSMSSGEVEHIYISLWQICLERYLLRFSQHMHDFCRSTTENVWCLFLHSQVEYLFVVLAVSITNVEHTSIAVLLPTF